MAVLSHYQGVFWPPTYNNYTVSRRVCQLAGNLSIPTGKRPCRLCQVDVLLFHLEEEAPVSNNQFPREGLIICNLKHLMDERHLSIAETSRITGLSRPTVRKLKQNRFEGVSTVTVARLCSMLRIGVGRLFIHKTQKQLIAEYQSEGEAFVGASNT